MKKISPKYKMKVIASIAITNCSNGKKEDKEEYISEELGILDTYDIGEEEGPTFQKFRKEQLSKDYQLMCALPHWSSTPSIRTVDTISNELPRSMLGFTKSVTAGIFYIKVVTRYNKDKSHFYHFATDSPIESAI